MLLLFSLFSSKHIRNDNRRIDAKVVRSRRHRCRSSNEERRSDPEEDVRCTCDGKTGKIRRRCQVSLYVIYIFSVKFYGEFSYFRKL